jgi:hypothetical protein
VDVGASVFVAGASSVQHAPAPRVVAPPASPLEPAAFIYQEQQRLEEAKYTFSPEERARVDQFNAERAQENARLEGELAGLDAQIAQERAAYPGQETRRLRDLQRQRGEVASRIKPPLDLAQVTAEIEAVMNDSSLSDGQQKQALEDIRNKYGLKKHGGPVSMHDTFTGRLARLTKDSMHRLDEARKTAERALDAQIREAERKYGRRSPEVAALKAQKAQLSAMYKEERSHLAATESFLYRAFRKKKRGLFARIKNAFKKAFKKIGRGIANVAKSAFRAVTSLGKGLLKGAGALFRGDLKGAFRAVTTGIKDTVHHAFQALRSAVPLVTSLIPGMAALMAIPKVGGFITKIQQGLVDAAASITQGVIKTWTHLGEGVLNGASALAKGDFKGAFKAVGQSTKEALKSGWKTFNEALPYLVTAACFVPGLNVVAIPLRLAMAARDLAMAIKNKDALGIAGAVVDGVAGGAVGRGMKLVARAADVAGQGISVAHGVQAAARGDALGAVAGFAGGAAGRGRMGEVAGNVSLGASAMQAGMARDSAGVFQAAGGIAGSRRARPQQSASHFDETGSSPARTTSRGLTQEPASRGLGTQTASRGLAPEVTASRTAERDADTRRAEERKQEEERLQALARHRAQMAGLRTRGGGGPTADGASSNPVTTARGLPEATTSSVAPERKRTREDLPGTDGAGPSGTHGEASAPASKKSRTPGSTPGTYANIRNDYKKAKKDGTLPQDFRAEVDHQPARQVYTGESMTRQQAGKLGLVNPGPAFAVREDFHRQHITTGSSKDADQFRADQRKLLLSGPNGQPDSRTRLDVEQLSMVEYAHLDGFQRHANSGSAESRFMEQTFKKQGQAPLPVIDASGQQVSVPYKNEHQLLRELSYEAMKTGVWPTAKLEELNRKLESEKASAGSEPLPRAAGASRAGDLPRTPQAQGASTSSASQVSLQQKQKASKYDRFWDLHLTHSNGHYDFADNIYEQVDHQSRKPNLSDGKVLIGGIQPGASKIQALPLQGGLPSKGMVASMVSLEDIRQCRVTPEAQELVKWINESGQRGKLRINSHGDGMGRLGMKDGQGGWQWVDASAVVSWLRANGLDDGGKKGNERQEGLSTINVAACMAARAGTKPATYNARRDQSSAAEGSAVDAIVKQLQAQKVHGVQVTGSNEITVSGGGQMSRTLGTGIDVAPTSWLVDATRNKTTGKDEYFIDIPKGWQVKEAFRRGWEVHIPKAYDIQPDALNTQQEPSAGWSLKLDRTRPGAQGLDAQVEVPAGWILDPQRRVIKPPLGWNVTAHKDGGGRLTPPNGGGLTEKLTHSPYKVRDVA